jgi:hypothetical protein
MSRRQVCRPPWLDFIDPNKPESHSLLHEWSGAGRRQEDSDGAYAVGLIRGRVRRKYPDLSPREVNLIVSEEIDRVERISSSTEADRL